MAETQHEATLRNSQAYQRAQYDLQRHDMLARYELEQQNMRNQEYYEKLRSEQNWSYEDALKMGSRAGVLEKYKWYESNGKFHNNGDENNSVTSIYDINLNGSFYYSRSCPFVSDHLISAWKEGMSETVNNYTAKIEGLIDHMKDAGSKGWISFRVPCKIYNDLTNLDVGYEGFHVNFNMEKFINSDPADLSAENAAWLEEYRKFIANRPPPVVNINLELSNQPSNKVIVDVPDSRENNVSNQSSSVSSKIETSLMVIVGGGFSLAIAYMILGMIF